MTIFDTIRYPISDKPTSGQLEALPTSVFNKWMASQAWWDTTTFDQIAGWFRSDSISSHYKTVALAAIRKIIEDYDEPI